MPRALTAILVTVVVTVLLVNFKAQPAVTIAPGASAKQSNVRSPAPARSAPPFSPPSEQAPAPRRTVVGPAVLTAYGTVQVSVTVAGRRVQDVQAVVLPSGNPTTDSINSQAGPLLREEALAAQTAGIDTISGASYTSEGYRESLQAALDRANA